MYPSSDDYCADSEAFVRYNENSLFSVGLDPSESISVNLSTFTTVLDFAVLPGIESKDDSLNPCEVWMQTSHGRFRFKECVWYLSLPPILGSDVASQATIRFLRVVLGPMKPQKVHPATDAGNMLVPSLSGIPVDDNSPVDVTRRPPLDPKSRHRPMRYLGRRSTWLRSFGTFAFFVVAGPAPHNAEVLREGCVPVPS
jgi:hypothetical protein